jgi:hypothetical protein
MRVSRLAIVGLLAVRAPATRRQQSYSASTTPTTEWIRGLPDQAIWSGRLHLDRRKPVVVRVLRPFELEWNRDAQGLPV